MDFESTINRVVAVVMIDKDLSKELKEKIAKDLREVEKLARIGHSLKIALSEGIVELTHAYDMDNISVDSLVNLVDTNLVSSKKSN